MADPKIKKQDLLQSSPEPVHLGSIPTFRLNIYQDDGTNQVDQTNTPTVNNSSCSIANVTDLDTAVATPTVTEAAITNGTQLSFPIDTTASPFNAIGRFIAKLQYDFNGETQIDYIFFNVVDQSNVFGSNS